RAPRGAQARRAQGANRRRVGARPSAVPRRRGGCPGCRAPLSRTLPRSADARPLPLRATGRGLEVYRRTRAFLNDELGLEPGVELQELERAILTQDPVLNLGPNGAATT